MAFAMNRLGKVVGDKKYFQDMPFLAVIFCIAVLTERNEACIAHVAMKLLAKYVYGTYHSTISTFTTRTFEVTEHVA